MTRNNSAKKQHVTVGLSQLAFDALGEAEAGSARKTPVKMKSALRCYLGDRGTKRPAWPYPDFLRGSESQVEARVEFDIEADLWREFEQEAAIQGVSVDQLAEHTAFYFAAEASAGRLTQRILEDLESVEGDEQQP